MPRETRRTILKMARDFCGSVFLDLDFFADDWCYDLYESDSRQFVLRCNTILDLYRDLEARVESSQSWMNHRYLSDAAKRKWDLFRDAVMRNMPRLQLEQNAARRHLTRRQHPIRRRIRTIATIPGVGPDGEL